MERRVLVIDDEAALRRLAGELIASWGYQVATAEDALTGIKLLMAEPVDLVVTDYHTPRGCGLDVLGWLRSQDRGTPVFMVSGSWTEQEEARARLMGAKTFEKPCDWGELRRQMAEALKPASADSGRRGT